MSNQGTHETSQVTAVTPDSHSQHGGTSRVMFSLLPVALMLSALWRLSQGLGFEIFCYYNLSRANASREVWQAGCGQRKCHFCPSCQRSRALAVAARLWLTNSGECCVLAASLLIKLIEGPVSSCIWISMGYPACSAAWDPRQGKVKEL